VPDVDAFVAAVREVLIARVPDRGLLAVIGRDLRDAASGVAPVGRNGHSLPS
jgi:hypothetical protein